MHDENQDDPASRAGEPASFPPALHAAGDLTEPTPPPASDAITVPLEFDSTPSIHDYNDRALLVWLIAIFALGVGGLLLRQEELSALVALAGLFVAAQAADLDPQWRFLYYALAWVVPVTGAFVFGSIVMLLRAADLSEPVRISMIALSVFGGLVSLVLWWRPIADPLTRLLFRGDPPSHGLRLAMRLIVLALLLAIPGWFALRDTIMDLLSSGTPLLTQATFVGSLVGYVLLALASVGFMIRRDLRATLERLGITRVRWRDLLVIVVGAGALYGLNTAADWAQHRYFPDLAPRQRDERVRWSTG
jgi:hypothetical protein